MSAKAGLAFSFNLLKINGLFRDSPPEWDIKLNTGWKITKLRDYFPGPKRIPE